MFIHLPLFCLCFIYSSAFMLDKNRTWLCLVFTSFSAASLTSKEYQDNNTAFSDFNRLWWFLKIIKPVFLLLLFFCYVYYILFYYYYYLLLLFYFLSYELCFYSLVHQKTQDSSTFVENATKTLVIYNLQNPQIKYLLWKYQWWDVNRYIYSSIVAR